MKSAVNSASDSPRDGDNRRSGAVLTAVIVAIFLGGVGLATVGLAGRGGGDEVVLEIDDLSAPVPSTVPPLVDPAGDPADAPTGGDSDPGDAAGDDALAADDDAALSPLAELLGPTYSAVPEEITPRPRPVRVDIESFDVARFPIRAVGLEPDGQLEVPDETEIGWYQYGATAGRPGATVLAAHVSWNGVVGPFGQLGTLEPGELISVTLDDGTTRTYEVFERTIYGKQELPRERIWRNTGPETLVLITCGGDFNPEIRRYRENIVVYAAPVS